jgi:hypothetical protein
MAAHGARGDHPRKFFAGADPARSAQRESRTNFIKMQGSSDLKMIYVAQSNLI